MFLETNICPRNEAPRANVLVLRTSSKLIRFIFLLSDLNICSDGDNKFTTPLQMAARFNSPNTAHLLILNGANVAKQSNYGQQALHYAARRGNLKVVQVRPYLKFFLYFFFF